MIDVFKPMLPALVIAAISVMTLCLGGCVDEPEPFMIGEGHLRLTGETEADIDCRFIWVPQDEARGGGIGARGFEAARATCGEPEGPILGMTIYLLKREDNTYPRVEEMTYSPIFYKEDCPLTASRCASINYGDRDELYRSLPDAGSLTITRITATQVSGSFDAELATSKDEPRKTIHVTGDFEATLQ